MTEYDSFQKMVSECRLFDLTAHEAVLIRNAHKWGFTAAMMPDAMSAMQERRFLKKGKHEYDDAS